MLWHVIVYLFLHFLYILSILWSPRAVGWNAARDVSISRIAIWLGSARTPSGERKASRGHRVWRRWDCWVALRGRLRSSLLSAPATSDSCLAECFFGISSDANSTYMPLNYSSFYCWIRDGIGSTFCAFSFRVPLLSSRSVPSRPFHVTLTLSTYSLALAYLIINNRKQAMRLLPPLVSYLPLLALSLLFSDWYNLLQ